MQKQVIRNSLILSALLIVSASAFAADSNNELVKMDFNQASDGSVKLNIYTDKPYNDQIIVNKKPDNKYVILLPETTNALGVKPDISGVSSLNNVDVRTQQYSSLPGKDYTKIIIDSKKPINVVPQAHVTKKVTPERRTTTRPYMSPQQVQRTVPQRVLNQQRPVTNNDFIQERRQTTTLAQPNYVAQPQTAQQRTVRRETPVQRYVQPTRQTETPSILRQVTQSLPVQQVQQVSQPQQQTVVVDNSTSPLTQNEQVALEDNNKNEQEFEEKSKSAIDDDDISEDDLAFFKKIIRFKQKVVRKIKKLLSVRISFSSFMTVLQFILLVGLIKVVGDLIKKVQEPAGSVSQPVTRRLIHDNDETFEQAYPSYSNMDVYNTNRSNFEEDNKEGFNVKPLSAPMKFSSIQPKVQKNLYSNSNYRQPQPYSAQDDFYQPLSKISKEDKMSIFDENSQDIEKTIFKNPLTSISKQDEAILFDEETPEVENSPFNKDEYSINESQDDFFGYNGNSNNDEDFFIFEDEDEDDDVVDFQEDYMDEDELEDGDEYEYVDEDDEEYEYVDDEEANEVDEVQDVEEPVEEQQPQAPDPFEHLSVQAKYVIDANRGFAQVSVDGINALIGYVGSKISVIRKFKEDVKGQMQVRLNEQPDAETMIYIIKLGSYKTLVEVKPNSIRQLLDL